MTNVEKLNETSPELVDQYRGLSHVDLLNAICGEVLDLFAMQERVQVFMNECTMNLSKTNYTPEAIKQMISEKQEWDLDVFCADFLDDAHTDEDILKAVKERGQTHLDKYGR